MVPLFVLLYCECFLFLYCFSVMFSLFVLLYCRCFRASSGLDLLVVRWVSKAQAWQRSGRAGREAPGVCYRLYTEDEFDKLDENTTPEILRWLQREISNQIKIALSWQSVIVVFFGFGRQSHRTLDAFGTRVSNYLQTVAARCIIQYPWSGSIVSCGSTGTLLLFKFFVLVSTYDKTNGDWRVGHHWKFLTLSY